MNLPLVTLDGMSYGGSMLDPNVETERLLEEVSRRQRNEIASWEAAGDSDA